MTEPQRPTPAGTDDTGDAAVPEPRPVEEPEVEESTAEDSTAEEPTGADEDTSQEASAPPEGSAQPEGSDGPAGVAPPAPRRRRRRDPLAAALIGILTLLLGFAFAVQVRSTDDTDQQLAGAREEDLVRILDEQSAQEDRLRQQIADQRSALDQLNNSDSQSVAALEEARQRADAIGILNGTIAAQGPGLRMVIRDPGAEVRVADILDAIQELRGAGAETMQIDGIRIAVSSAVTGEPGALLIDGQKISAPYELVVIGSPQNLETAMNIPGGVVQRIGGRGGSVEITQAQQVVVDALRPLDTPQYASPESDGG